jgi:hypothetical protein
MPTTKPQRDELRRLREEATRVLLPPWQIVEVDVEDETGARSAEVASIITDDGEPVLGLASARFAVAVCNAAPALLDEADTRDGEIAELKDVLARVFANNRGFHRIGCGLLFGYSWRRARPCCTCGVAELEARVHKVLGVEVLR